MAQDRYNFRPPVASDAVAFTKGAVIAVAGPSGSGKTESLMRLARGYCGPEKRFCIIDTEEKRALYKRARYQPWDWVEFPPPFSPEATRAVIESVMDKYDVVILDSMSAEYTDEGGLEDIALAELERLAKGDPDKMEKLIAPSWKKAKVRHKHEVMTLIRRYPKLLLLSLRAEPKVKFTKEKFQRRDGGEGEKTVIVDAGYQPICEKMFMYDMLASFMMYAENAGVPEQVKALEEDLRPVFLQGKQLDEATGQRLAAWAKGSAPQEIHQRAAEPLTAGVASPPSPAAAGSTVITEDQAIVLEDKCRESSIPVARLCAAAKVSALRNILAKDHQRALDWISRHATQTQQQL